MRVSPQRKKELDKRNQFIYNLHISGYSYSEIITKLDSPITPARIGQIILGLKHNVSNA